MAFSRHPWCYSLSLFLLSTSSPIPNQGCLPHFTHLPLQIPCLVVLSFTFRSMIDQGLLFVSSPWSVPQIAGSWPLHYVSESGHWHHKITCQEACFTLHWVCRWRYKEATRHWCRAQSSLIYQFYIFLIYTHTYCVSLKHQCCLFVI